MLDLCILICVNFYQLQNRTEDSRVWRIENRKPLAELLSCGEVEMAGAGCARVARDSLDTWLGAGAELEPEQWPSCPHLEVLTLAGGGRLGAGAGQLMDDQQVRASQQGSVLLGRHQPGPVRGPHL